MTVLSHPVFHRALSAKRDTGDEVTQSMVAHLDRLCEGHLTPGHTDFIDYKERQSDWWRARAGGRILPSAVERLAAGGVLIDPRYTDEAVAILRAIVEHRIVEECGGTNYGRPYSTWRDNPLDAGASSHALAIGLDLLRPTLSAADLARFGAYLVPFVDYILENPPDPKEEKPDWNIALIGYVGTALLALVLAAMGALDEDRRDESVRRARRRVLLFMDKGHDGQGAFFEGPAYGSASVHYAAALGFALARSGDTELVKHAGLARMAEGLAYELIPGSGQVNPLNDCGNTINVSWVPLVAAEQHSGLAQWLWRQAMGWPGDGSPDSFDWTDAVTRYLLYFDPSVSPTPPDACGLPRARHFSHRGLVDVRSGWGRDDTLLSFVCDVYPAGGHRQADRNHFALHTLGESFAIDSGYALEAMEGTTEVLRRGAMGEAHNLPLVHGRMQQRGQVDGDRIVRADLDQAWPYIESEAGASYASGWGFRRRVVCLPGAGGEPACTVVADRLTFAGTEPRPMLSWLLHTAADNTVELERDRLTIVGGRYGNRCAVHMVTPWPGRWRQEEFLDHPRLRYDWFCDHLLCLVVLVPYEKGKDPPVIASEGSAAGCGLTLSVEGHKYGVLSASPGQEVSFGGISTDAELAVVALDEGAPSGHLVSGGTRLTVGDSSVVEKVSGLGHVALFPE